MQQNRHSIFIATTAFEIFPQILLWGEAAWWPKKSQMKFIRQTKGEIRIGTKYLQQVLLPFAPQWEAEISEIEPNRKVCRRFLNGIFKGQEWVELEPTAIGTRVNYVMDYDINGLINRMMWQWLFQRLHDRNIEMILANLKDFVTGKK